MRRSTTTAHSATELRAADNIGYDPTGHRPERVERTRPGRIPHRWTERSDGTRQPGHSQRPGLPVAAKPELARRLPGNARPTTVRYSAGQRLGREIRCRRPCRRRGCSSGTAPGSCGRGHSASWCAGRRAAAIWTSRSSTPASSIVVTKVCRSMCGCMRGNRTTETSVRHRNRRVAARRSILRPRWLSRTDPLTRSPTARSIALPTDGGSGKSLTWQATLRVTEHCLPSQGSSVTLDACRPASR
jgi:hypothetical protein